MLDCDRCHRWFHASCAGIDTHLYTAESLAALPWFCHDCQTFYKVFFLSLPSHPRWALKLKIWRWIFTSINTNRLPPLPFPFPLPLNINNCSSTILPLYSLPIPLITSINLPICSTILTIMPDKYVSLSFFIHSIICMPGKCTMLIKSSLFSTSRPNFLFLLFLMPTKYMTLFLLIPSILSLRFLRFLLFAVPFSSPLPCTSLLLPTSSSLWAFSHLLLGRFDYNAIYLLHY